MAFVLPSKNVNAQSQKRLYKSFVPYQWEIYNTVYKKRYWDRRDNRDYITFDKDKTFKRRYQGTDMSGKWIYNRKKKVITLAINKPFKKTVILRVKKLSSKTLVISSSEEDFKVKMYLQKGVPPRGKIRRRVTRPKKKAKKKN